MATWSGFWKLFEIDVLEDMFQSFPPDIVGLNVNGYGWYPSGDELSSDSQRVQKPRFKGIWAHIQSGSSRVLSPEFSIQLVSGPACELGSQTLFYKAFGAGKCLGLAIWCLDTLSLGDLTLSSAASTVRPPK